MGSPTFDEAAEPGWCQASAPRVALLVANEEVDFRDLRPARTPAPVPTSALANSNATSIVDPGEEEDDVLADPKPKVDLEPAASTVQLAQVQAPPLIPAPAPAPRRSERHNRGVPSQRLA